MRYFHALLVLVLLTSCTISLPGQTDQSDPLQAAKPDTPEMPRTSATIGTILYGPNNKGFGFGYQRVDKTFIGSISAFILDVGYESHGTEDMPVRPHTINMGYDFNIGGKLSSWFGIYGGIGLFFPVYTYSGQENVIGQNESYSSSVNIGIQFYPWRFVIGGGATYYLAYIYGPEFSVADQEAFKEIWNINVHCGWRF